MPSLERAGSAASKEQWSGSSFAQGSLGGKSPLTCLGILARYTCRWFCLGLFVCLFFNSAPEITSLCYRAWETVLFPLSSRGLVPVAVLGQVWTVLLGLLRHLDNDV